MKCTSEKWDHCRVEKMGCPGCYYDDSKLEEAIEITNNIADMAVYNYIPNNKNEMVLKGKPAYILGDKGRTAIKTVLQALKDIDNYKETSYTSEYFRGVNKCEEKWRKKIGDKIKELQKNIGTNVEYGFSTKYLQNVKVDIDAEIVKVLQELLEGK